jgi:hypothetical protein
VPLRSTTWWIWKARGKKLEIKDYNTKKQSFKKKIQKAWIKVGDHSREGRPAAWGRNADAWTTLDHHAEDRQAVRVRSCQSYLDRSSRLATTVSFQHNSMHHHQECTKPWPSLLPVYLSSRVSAIADGWLDVSIMWYTAFMPCKSHTSMELCIQASAVVALFSSRVGTHGRIFHHRLLVGLATGAG